MQPTELYLKLQNFPQTKAFVVRNPSSDKIMVKVTADFAVPLEFDHHSAIIEPNSSKLINMTIDEEKLNMIHKTSTYVLFYMLPILEGKYSSDLWIQQNSFSDDEMVFKLLMKVSEDEFSSPKIILDLPLSTNKASDERMVFIESTYIDGQSDEKRTLESYIKQRI